MLGNNQYTLNFNSIFLFLIASAFLGVSISFADFFLFHFVLFISSNLIDSGIAIKNSTKFTD